MTFIFKTSRSEESVMSKSMGKNDGFACLMEAQFNNKRTGTGNVLVRSILCV